MAFTVVFADYDEPYMERLRDFFLPEYGEEWELRCFCQKSELEDYLRTTKDVLLILSQEFLNDMQKQLTGIPILVLMEDAKQELLPGAEAVFKYQRMERIHDKIEKGLQEREKLILFPQRIAGKIYLFQSASGGSGTSTMAAACARALNRMGKKVLYLNLEEYGVSGFYFHKSGNGNILSYMDDIHKGASPEAALKSHGKEDENGVLFLDAVRNVMEYSRIDMTGLLKSMRRLCEEGSVDYVVVDKPLRLYQAHIQWMLEADRVIFVENGTDVGNLKFARVFLGIKGSLGETARMNEKFRLIYNRVNTGNFQDLSQFHIMALGMMGNQNGVSGEKIIVAAADSGMFQACGRDV